MPDSEILKRLHAILRTSHSRWRNSERMRKIHARHLTSASTRKQLSTGFQAALAASNAYYNARIANAQNALAQETAGTEAYNTLQTRIFAFGRQRLQAQNDRSPPKINGYCNSCHKNGLTLPTPPAMLKSRVSRLQHRRGKPTPISSRDR